MENIQGNPQFNPCSSRICLTLEFRRLHSEHLCGEHSRDEQIALSEELRLDAVFAWYRSSHVKCA